MPGSVRVSGQARVLQRELVYVSDSNPGITREGLKAPFRYVGPSGRAVREKSAIRRIQSLAIPPAWTDVWIACDPAAHLQATGRDARGRKQYLYHAEFRLLREADKFQHLPEFVAALPKLRARVAADLRKRGLPRAKVLAAVVSLLEATLIRVGNHEYATSNGSFGLTTLQNHHANVQGDFIRFGFKGKSGRVWRLQLKDRRVANVVRAMQDLPGQHLFQYVDDGGAPQTISSGDVNTYLRGVTGRDITAKEFRTWAGTFMAVTDLSAREAGLSIAERKRHVRDMLKNVAIRLGNTPSVCRKSYIHPDVIESFMEGSLPRAVERAKAAARGRKGLSKQEAAVNKLLNLNSRRPRRGRGRQTSVAHGA